MYSYLGRITLRRAVSYVKKKEESQVVGGGVLSIVAAHSLPPSSHNTILALIEGTLKDISGHFRTSYAFL